MSQEKERYLVRWLIYSDSEEDAYIVEHGSIGCESYERAIEIHDHIRPLIDTKYNKNNGDICDIVKEDGNVFLDLEDDDLYEDDEED